MLIYRFRITAHEYEEFVREIDIQPKQNFLEFHHILVETAELKGSTGASFTMTDKKNKINHEITLKSTKKQIRRFDDDLGEVVMETKTLPLMKDTKIKNFIEDPHQRILYKFHGKETYSFQIDLYKIIQSENFVSYPRVSKKYGEIRKIPDILPPAPVPEIEVPVIVAKPQKTKPIIQVKPDTLSKLDSIEENIDEISAIDKELSEILEEEAPVQLEIESQIATTEDIGESEYGQDEQMEHIDEFGDLDQIDQRYSNYREESDDL
jgi:regulator of replication initiation timing